MDNNSLARWPGIDALSASYSPRDTRRAGLLPAKKLQEQKKREFALTRHNALEKPTYGGRSL